MLEFTGDSEFPLGVFADELVNKSTPNNILEKCQEQNSSQNMKRRFLKNIIFLIKTKQQDLEIIVVKS